MTYARKVDSTQSAIVAEFKRLGASVVDLSRVGQGCPDLCVGIAKQTALVECKRDAKAKFTPEQLDFLTYWAGQPVFRAHCVEDAQYIVHHMKGAKR